MLKRERYELQVGLVFIATLIFLTIGLLWAKRFRPHEAKMVVAVSFPTVGGLAKGDEARVSGLYMGTVSDIVLRKRDVLVTATLSRKIRINEDYSVHVATLTFTGEMGLAIDPGTGRPLPEPLPELKGTPPLELNDVVQPGLRALASVQAVADTVAWALPLITRKTSATLDRLDSVLAEAHESMATTRGPIRRTVNQLRRTLASTDRLVGTLSARADTSFAAADSTFASLTAASQTLRRVLAALDTTGGTLGRMIHDPELYDELRGATARLDSAAASMDSLAQDIKRDPKKYVHFSLF